MADLLVRPGVMGFAACVMVAGGNVPASAQSAVWDTAISNTNWYVPVPQLLAYAAPTTGFSNPIPIGDQTLWALGTSTNGSFTGTSSAQLAIGSNISTSNSTIQGFVTTSGQITMVFTPTSGGVTTVGLGQMRTINGVAQMEMQMITGQSLLVTHWAYMLPYNPATFTPPAPAPIPANSVPEWAWTLGSRWRIASPAMFGTASPGRFVISNYQNGYFWGNGAAPAGSSSGNFTLLGSVTPEGRVLFNTLSNGNLTSLYGAATGDASGSQMLTSTYDLAGNPTGALAYMSLVQPYAQVLAGQNNRAGLGAAAVLDQMASTPLGLTGAMAPTFSILDNLDAPALSSAVSQTLPVLAGAASQATYVTQRALQQTVAGRLDEAYGLRTAEAAAERHLWLRPLGGVASQNGSDGAPGYRATGGGVAAGIDAPVSPRAVLGGLFSYSNQTITGSNDAAPNRLGLQTYQLGLYGAYALRPGTEIAFLVDGGINQNQGNRSLLFVNSMAVADYLSYTGHAGVAVKQLIPVQPGLSFLPSLRLDYAEVRANAYSESGAGGLSLNVDSQIYRELMLSAGVKGSYRITDRIHLVADTGVGYNLLNDRLQISATYVAGGDSFVTTAFNSSPWLYTAGIGLVANWTDNLDLSARYGVQTSPSGFLGQSGSFALRINL
ncbi:autotransporter outer membrane beta-barrel domain-containing protein [Bradyrhizobium sp. 190]|uniref:autotransporter family protein n=1 Tax=Bradyrhizobium sp. 190 TaxID=2782658 RepID=UPI001FFAED81|nr:autotransporter outer membrane beta-barrel domain-containing protein [Bradyrhizobium sp. 190]MCK1517940.1 autotransporter outer membrane beta-barrel domain-containing protein [Bradyrhizobium sp. 190]